VATPHAGELLASSKIAVLPQPDQLNFYQRARWSDPAPVLLRDRIIDALHADGRIAALSSDADDIVADLLLTGDLRAFQSEYRDGAPHVVIRLDARLVRTKNQSIAASRRFEVIEPVGATAVGDVVRAFGVASDRLASQVRDWALQQRP
jgi:cholesterol transport system auxiliary component